MAASGIPHSCGKAVRCHQRTIGHSGIGSTNRFTAISAATAGQGAFATEPFMRSPSSSPSPSRFHKTSAV
jgi:hypothetical protein